jgi:hypothetical protein
MWSPALVTETDPETLRTSLVPHGSQVKILVYSESRKRTIELPVRGGKGSVYNEWDTIRASPWHAVGQMEQLHVRILRVYSETSPAHHPRFGIL